MNNTSLQFRSALPKATDVVVIGGGVIGTFTALYLNRMGLQVTLCEKGRVAGEQSSRNWGWVRCMNRDPKELPLAMEAHHLWKEVDAQVEGLVGFKQCGIQYLCSTEKQLESWDFWLEIAKTHGLDSHYMTSQQVADKFPSLKSKYAGALCTPTDGRAEPWTAVPAVAQLAQLEGVTIREKCAVRGLEVLGGTTLKGVVTEDGTIACEQVVLAGGAWSAMLARRHGIHLPQLLVKGTVAATEQLPAVVDGQIKDEKIAIRRREDGGYTLALPNVIHHVGPDSFRNAKEYLPLLATMPDFSIRPPPSDFHHPNAWLKDGAMSSWDLSDESPFERTRVLDPPPDVQTVLNLQRLFADRFPDICSTVDGVPKIKQAWAGMIDAMPDVVPVVDRVDEIEGVIVATGMSAHGFGIGPAFGKAVANIAMGNEVGHDMYRFRSSRFSDGSKIVPGPGL
jgi:glycine/D-amino acid oxidase-like deaminating enzyme